MNSINSSQSGVTAQSAPAKTESSSTQSSSARKLPYQATHQVELMHLEAETEALLQQLRALKQRRQIRQDTPPTAAPLPELTPALAIR